MGDNRAHSVKVEVQELLIKPLQDVEERRQSIIGGAKLLRQGSIVASEYDQVPKGDMARRYREQSNNPRRDSTVLVQSEVAKVEPPRLETYQIEVPKSGVFNRGEYFTPLYLPTGCEEEVRSRYYEGFEQATTEDEINEPSDAATPKDIDIIRNMVYCSDEVLWAEYQEQQGISPGAKTHFGLHFDSNFECGNLFKAETVQARGAPLDDIEEYDLTIRTDPAQFNKLDVPDAAANPTCAQWFFFRVYNTKRKTYRFNIGPFSHRIEALEKGMKPVMISESAYKIHGTGWQRVGENVTFQEVATDSNRSGSSNIKRTHPTFTLSFELTLEVAKDVFYLAFAPPYTYTQLQNMLFALVKDPIASKDLLVRPLCRTLAGNRCDLVTISENISTQGKNALDGQSSSTAKYRSRENDLQENDEDIPDFLWKIQQKMDAQRRAEEEKHAEKHRKKAVFVTARIHGGETVSSWMCEGLIKFLLSLHPTAVALKKVFVFYILPMVNPDGVVNGYAKSDIIGTDLNQHWAEPSSALHPTLFHFKAAMRRAQDGNGEIHAFFDLHGQAAKEGIFFHSVLSPSARLRCSAENQKSDQVRQAESTTAHQQTSSVSLKPGDPRNFTIAAARRCPLLNLKQCSLQLNSRKHTSARAVAASEFQVSLSVAVEASFHRSPAHKSKCATQLTSADYARFGCVLALALSDINNIGPPPSSRLLPAEKEKPTRVCRASLKAAGLAQSMVQSAAAAAEAAVSAVNASLSTAPFSPTVRDDMLISPEGANTRKRSVIYTASQTAGAKRDSFLIGASVPMPHSEILLSRSRAATATDADLEGTGTAETGVLNHADEHTHFYVSENIDPTEFDDSDLQLHYDEDKWEAVSDSSDADVLLPSEPGPPPVNEEGVINLTDDMLFNLRRYDELDLGIARVNPIALLAKMKQQAKPKVSVEAVTKKPASETEETEKLPQVAGASADSAILDAPIDSSALDLLDRNGNMGGNIDSIPGSPYTPRRPSIQSPGRSSTAHSRRKSIKSANAEARAASREAESARLHSATATFVGDQSTLEVTMKPTSAGQGPTTERGQSRGGEVAVRMDRLGPDVEVVRISTAEPGAKPLTPHTNKKGNVKLSFTRDLATTSALGGLPGKQLGEPKGTVSFSVPANAGTENRFHNLDHDLDLNEGSLTSDFDFSQASATESAKTTTKVSPRKTSFSERTGSGKANYPVVMVPTAPLPSDTPDFTPKPVHNREGSSFFPEHVEGALLPSAEDGVGRSASGQAEGDNGHTDALRLNTGMEEHEHVEAALSPFSIQLNVPVQGIDPLNNSMSPLFALYAGGAALYSERVTEIIEEQQRAKTAERLRSAAGSRPVTTHSSRLTTPALNTHTRATDRGRPQSPPLVGEQRLEGSVQTESSRGKKMASMTLPFVRLAPTEHTRGSSQTSSAIMFDDSLADESVNAHFSGMSLLKLTPGRLQAHSHLLPSSPQHAHFGEASVVDARTPLEKQQAQFLHEMGLEYKQIFGEQGVLSPQKKRPLLKHSPRSALEERNTATYSTGFPLRRAMYERDAVQLRGTAEESIPVLVHEKHKGVGKIRPVEKERVYLRHQLDQYYQHIESSLREQQLVEEAQTEITAKRIFDLVHQVSLLDAEELSRMKLQETLQRRWLAAGGHWKGKHRFRENNSHISAPTESSMQTVETPESRQLAYRKLRMKLKSHGSAEGSILQGYNDLIMGSEEDPGNGWQWLTGQEGADPVPNGESTDNNVVIPTASVSENVDGEADRLGSAETGGDSREVMPFGEVPEGLAFNPLLPSDNATNQPDSPGNAQANGKVHKNHTGSGGKKIPRVIGQSHPVTGSPVQSADSKPVHQNTHAHVHFPLHDEPKQSNSHVPYAMDPRPSDQYQVQRKPPRHLSLNPNSPVRTLISPPQARISLFPGRAEESKRSVSPVGRSQNHHNAPALSHDARANGSGNGSRHGRGGKSPKRQLAVTLRSAPVEDRLHSAAPASAPVLPHSTDFPNSVGNDEHFPEAQPHTDELQPLPGIKATTSSISNTSSSQAAELMRMDSEYANYLRYGDIYTQSILAGVETEQLSLHGSGLVLPSANTLRENDNSAVNAVKFNPLLSKRLYAVAGTQPNPSHHHNNHTLTDTLESYNSSTDLHVGAHLEEPTVEILARDLKQAIHTRQVELETTAPRVFIHPDKLLSPRRPGTERPSPMAKSKAKVTYVAPPVQEEGYPVTPRLAITASRPEGTVLRVASPSHVRATAGQQRKNLRGAIVL